MTCNKPFFTILSLFALLSTSAFAEQADDAQELIKQNGAKLHIWRMLAEWGDGEAAYHLAQAYGFNKTELGKTQDDSHLKIKPTIRSNVQYKKWLILAAENGYAPAQRRLASHYVCFNYRSCRGDDYDIEKDNSEAAKWFRKAAEQGDTKSQDMLGKLYRDGTGVPKDKTIAEQWFSKSCENGDNYACTHLNDLRKEDK